LARSSPSPSAVTFGISASWDLGAICYAALIPAAALLRPNGRTAPVAAAA